MHKSLRALLAEGDQEYTYWIKSTYNIHEDEVMDQIRLAMLPYDLRAVEEGAYKPIGAGNKDFPNVPDSPSYSVKVILGLEPEEADDPLQKVALFTRINTEHLLVHKDGVDPHAEPKAEAEGEYKNLAQHAKDFTSSLDDVVAGAQDEVGEKRVGTFLKDLEAQLKKEREAIRQITPKLKESFVTSHIALNNVKGGWKRGFYVVERAENDQGNMKISGPFAKQPTNFEFIAELAVPGAGVLTVESSDSIIMEAYDRNFKYTLKPTRSKTMVEAKFSVDVQDQDTGKVYNVVIDAMDDARARDRAVLVVARQNKLNQETLIATDPEMS
jgi:hypothetical protein